MFSRLSIRCCICGAECDGMRGYGQARVCDKECHNELEWRRSLAILGKPYTPQKGSRWDKDEPRLTPPFPRDAEAMEPCCECGESYPRADLLAGHIYCSTCRRGCER